MKVRLGSSVLELPRLGNDGSSCPDSVGRKRIHHTVDMYRYFNGSLARNIRRTISRELEGAAVHVLQVFSCGDNAAIPEKHREAS